jgi:hypothetical protein
MPKTYGFLTCFLSLLEADITLEMTAPDVTGRHVAYFRLLTSEGTSFGQRLWASVRVSEIDGWHLVERL